MTQEENAIKKVLDAHLLTKLAGADYARQVAEILAAAGFLRPVRCRECRHFRALDADTAYCNKSMIGVREPDGFCHEGERRSERDLGKVVI